MNWGFVQRMPVARNNSEIFDEKSVGKRSASEARGTIQPTHVIKYAVGVPVAFYAVHSAHGNISADPGSVSAVGTQRVRHYI